MSELAHRRPRRSDRPARGSAELAGDDPELVARCRCQRGIVLLRAGDFAQAARELDVVVAEPQWFTAAGACGHPGEPGRDQLRTGSPGRRRARRTPPQRVLAAEVGDAPAALHGRVQSRLRPLPHRRPARRARRAMAAAEADRRPTCTAARHSSPSPVCWARPACSTRPSRPSTGRRRPAVRATASCARRSSRERAVLLRLTGEFAEAARAARRAGARFRRLGAPDHEAAAALIALDCDLSRGRRLPDVLAGALALRGHSRGSSGTAT